MIFLTVLALVLLAAALVGQYRMQKQLDRMHAQLIHNRIEADKEATAILDNVVDTRVQVLDQLRERELV